MLTILHLAESTPTFSSYQQFQQFHGGANSNMIPNVSSEFDLSGCLSESSMYSPSLPSFITVNSSDNLPPKHRLRGDASTSPSVLASFLQSLKHNPPIPMSMKRIKGLKRKNKEAKSRKMSKRDYLAMDPAILGAVIDEFHEGRGHYEGTNPYASEE